MPEITLANGRKVLLDTKDYIRLNKYTWCYSGNGHVATSKGVYIHYAVLELSPKKGLEIDHVDGNPLNNRRSNLRIVNRQQNNANHFKSKKPCSSKYKGVFKIFRYYKAKTYIYWIAQICVNYKTKYLGLFKDEIEAAKTYNKAAVKYFGEFARINQL